MIKKILLRIKYINWNKRLRNKTNIIDRKTLLDKFGDKINFYNKNEKFEINFSNHQFYIGIIPQTKPKVLTFLSTNTLHIPQPFYLSLNNALLVGNMAVAVIEEKIILESTLNSIHYLNKTGDAKYLQKVRNFQLTKNVYPKAISLVNILSNNYYHWLIDVLPIIEPIYSELRNDENFKIIIRKDAEKFQYEYLELIGLKKNVINWKSLSTLIKQLIISSNRNIFLKQDSFQTDIISRTSIDWIRKSIINKVLSKSFVSYENIYISRINSNGRKIVNEDELDEILNKYSVKKIFLENYTIEAQIWFFMKAKRIIGAHGAGFTNIIFSNHLRILEFYPKEKISFSSFHQISSYLNHNHIQVDLPSINKNNDMKIEVGAFEEYLKLIF